MKIEPIPLGDALRLAALGLLGVGASYLLNYWGIRLSTATDAASTETTATSTGTATATASTQDASDTRADTSETSTTEVTSAKSARRSERGVGPGEERELLGGGGTAEGRVAMWIAPEALDDRRVLACPFEQVVAPGLPGERAEQRQRPALVFGRFAVLEGQIKEAALVNREVFVVTLLDRTARHGKRQSVGGELVCYVW